jgi:hypothetical protein
MRSGVYTQGGTEKVRIKSEIITKNGTKGRWYAIKEMGIYSTMQQRGDAVQPLSFLAQKRNRVDDRRVYFTTHSHPSVKEFVRFLTLRLLQYQPHRDAIVGNHSKRDYIYGTAKRLKARVQFSVLNRLTGEVHVKSNTSSP